MQLFTQTIKSPQLSLIRKHAKLTLSNGLKVCLISDPKTPSVGASVCVGSGSWDDSPEHMGISFLSYSFFHPSFLLRIRPFYRAHGISGKALIPIEYRYFSVPVPFQSRTSLSDMSVIIMEVLTRTPRRTTRSTTSTSSLRARFTAR